MMCVGVGALVLLKESPVNTAYAGFLMIIHEFIFSDSRATHSKPLGRASYFYYVIFVLKKGVLWMSAFGVRFFVTS